MPGSQRYEHAPTWAVGGASGVRSAYAEDLYRTTAPQTEPQQFFTGGDTEMSPVPHHAMQQPQPTVSGWAMPPGASEFAQDAYMTAGSLPPSKPARPSARPSLILTDPRVEQPEL